MIDKNKYSTSIFWSDEDEGYIAVVSEFPGLSAFGETKDEALREASDATDGFIETYKEQGKKLPEIHKIYEYSENIKIPRSLRTSLALAAKHEGVSLNSLIMSILSKWVDKQECKSSINKLSIYTSVGTEKTIQTYNNGISNYLFEPSENKFVTKNKIPQLMA